MSHIIDQTDVAISVFTNGENNAKRAMEHNKRINNTIRALRHQGFAARRITTDIVEDEMDYRFDHITTIECEALWRTEGNGEQADE